MLKNLSVLLREITRTKVHSPNRVTIRIMPIKRVILSLLVMFPSTVLKTVLEVPLNPSVTLIRLELP